MRKKSCLVENLLYVIAHQMLAICMYLPDQWLLPTNIAFNLFLANF